MSDDHEPLRDAIVAAGRRLGRRGLVAATEGNLSIRLADGRLLVTPAGRRKDELTADDLVVAPLDPAADGHTPRDARRPTSDIAIHRAIYAARPDVVAVAHAHLPVAMALTVAGEVPDPAVLPETAHFIPRLPLVAYGEMGSADLAARIATALSEPPEPFASVVLSERHGAVATASDEDPFAAIAQAVDRLELVDVLCRVWRDAVLLAAARRGAPPLGRIR